MEKINLIKEHYENAGKNFEAANRFPDYKTRLAYQEEGNKEFGIAQDLTEAAKKEVSTEACKEAKVYYDKSADAYERGDIKAAKEYQEKADKIMSDCKEMGKEIEKEAYKASHEARLKMDGLELTKY